MTAIKVTKKMFSGGSTKNLPETLIGLAIDNARNCFERMDHGALEFDNQIAGLLPPAFMVLPLPGKEASSPMPLTFWDTMQSGVTSLQLIAGKINRVLFEFGIEPITNAIENDQPIVAINMLISDTDEGSTEMNAGKQMGQLRDSITAVAGRMNDIRTALGMELLPGSTGGSLRCNQIYPLIIKDWEFGTGVAAVTLADWLEAFNGNLSFMVSEWNKMVGRHEPGFEIITQIGYDNSIITVPSLTFGEPTTDQIEIQPTEYALTFTNLAEIFRTLEIQVEALALRYEMPYNPVIEIATQGGRSLIIPELDMAEHDTRGVILTGVHSLWTWADNLSRSIKAMMTPLNHSLQLAGFDPIVDVSVEGEEEPEGTYTIPTTELYAALVQYNQAAAAIGNAIMILTNPEAQERTGLRVIAG